MSDALQLRSITTDDEIFQTSRNMAPRGTTPEPSTSFSTIIIPQGYTDRGQEYRQLRSRGATEEMCLAFSLEFDNTTGIVAWADKRVVKNFAGASMQPGDQWGIHIGRCVELSDADVDGWEFISELLEEVLLFNPWGGLNRWSTEEETPGIWVTKPLTTSDDDDGSESDSSEDEEEVEELEEEHGDPDKIKPNRYSNEGSSDDFDGDFDGDEIGSDSDSADSDFSNVYSDEDDLTPPGSPTASDSATTLE